MTNARPDKVISLVLAGAALALTLGFPAPAGAQGTPQQQQACQPDAFRLCNEFIPDVPKIQACMSRKRAQLSPACRAAIVGPPRARHARKTHHHH
jgi:hypothetical protein